MHTSSQDRADPRKSRTDKMLLEAFIEIAGSKPVGRITVKELVDKAQLARTTFYHNYLDMPDYIERTTDRILEDYSREAQICYLAPPASGAPVADIYTRNRVFFEYIAHNADFYRIMLGSNGDTAFSNKMKGLGLNFIYGLFTPVIAHMETTVGRKKRYEFALIANSVAASQITTLDFWLSDDMRLSTNYMAEYQTALSSSMFTGAGWV